MVVDPLLLLAPMLGMVVYGQVAALTPAAAVLPLLVLRVAGMLQEALSQVWAAWLPVKAVTLPLTAAGLFYGCCCGYCCFSRVVSKQQQIFWRVLVTCWLILQAIGCTADAASKAQGQGRCPAVLLLPLLHEALACFAAVVVAGDCMLWSARWGRHSSRV
jgi:hypothetical protein